jgi:L-gulonolactone oxidase
VIEELDDLQRSCQFLELFWFPFQENMWVYMMGCAVTRPDPPSWWRSLRSEVATTVQDVASKRLIPWIAKHMPRLTPTLNSVASRMAFSEGLAIQDASDAFHFQRAYAHCWDLEYGVPASEASRAWGEAVALVEHYASSRLYPVNLAVHGRFTGPSDAWLAPDHGRDTCYLEVTCAVGTPHWQSFFREMERRWCEIDGARPHWGKLYWQRDRIAGQYANFARFLEVRERWDPERVFLNRFLEREVFQLPARPAQPTRAAAPPLHPAPSPGPSPGHS